MLFCIYIEVDLSAVTNDTEHHLGKEEKDSRPTPWHLSSNCATWRKRARLSPGYPLPPFIHIHKGIRVRHSFLASFWPFGLLYCGSVQIRDAQMQMLNYVCMPSLRKCLVCITFQMLTLIMSKQTIPNNDRLWHSGAIMLYMLHLCQTFIPHCRGDMESNQCIITHDNAKTNNQYLCQCLFLRKSPFLAIISRVCLGLLCYD